MAKMTLKQRVDRTYEVTQQIRPLKKEADEGKDFLKAHAKKHKQEKIEGTKVDATFGPQPTPGADAKATYDAFVDLDREDDFWEVCNINLTNLKDVLGETKAAELIKVKRTPYGRMYFKKK